MGQTFIAIDRDELAEIVAQAVRDGAQATSHPNPKALTTRQLQAHYSISEGTVKNLRRAGLPHYFIGDSPRFDQDSVHAWLLEHGQVGT